MYFDGQTLFEVLYWLHYKTTKWHTPSFSSPATMVLQKTIHGNLHNSLPDKHDQNTLIKQSGAAI